MLNAGVFQISRSQLLWRTDIFVAINSLIYRHIQKHLFGLHSVLFHKGVSSRGFNAINGIQGSGRVFIGGELAADEDPTGTLNAINSVETAARDAFVEQHGMQPEEMFLDVAVNQRIDRYKNVSSPQELAAAYLEDTGIQQNIESALSIFC